MPSSSPRRRSSGTEAIVWKPFWTPDSARPYCALCAVSFTVFRRRHHCRACGDIFCAAHAGTYVHEAKFGGACIPAGADKSGYIRVCDVCKGLCLPRAENAAVTSARAALKLMPPSSQKNIERAMQALNPEKRASGTMAPPESPKSKYSSHATSNGTRKETAPAAPSKSKNHSVNEVVAAPPIIPAYFIFPVTAIVSFPGAVWLSGFNRKTTREDRAVRRMLRRPRDARS